MTSIENNKKIVTASVLVIGNEILSGRTKDANIPFLAEQLNEIGIQLSEVRVVKDIDVDIVEAVNALRKKYDYLFTTGGIGPTHDDITSASIAKAFDVPVERHIEAEKLIRNYYPVDKINAARLSMADLPKGIEIVLNPVSGAPGFRMDNVFVFAGIPNIMQAMFHNVKHVLIGGKKLFSRSVYCQLAESIMAPKLQIILKEFPTVEIGSYPHWGKGTSLVARAYEQETLSEAIQAIKNIAEELNGNPIEQE